MSHSENPSSIVMIQTAQRAPLWCHVCESCYCKSSEAAELRPDSRVERQLLIKDSLKLIELPRGCRDLHPSLPMSFFLDLTGCRVTGTSLTTGSVTSTKCSCIDITTRGSVIPHYGKKNWGVNLDLEGLLFTCSTGKAFWDCLSLNAAA